MEFRLGGFTLRKAVRDEVRWFAPYGIQVGEAPPKVRQAGFRPLTASFYRGDNPSFPQIGDMRVVYEAVPPTDVSIIAAHEGATLGAYRSKAGGTIAMVSKGRKSAQAMLEDALWWNRLKTWLWRAGGFVALWWGYGLALRPLTTLAGVLPGLFGGLAAATGFLTSLVLAVGVTLITTSFAWVLYRPEYGLPMLISGVIALLLLAVWGVRKRTAARHTKSPWLT